MWVVPEGEIAGLMTPEAAFDAVEAVFAAMARGEARNFPVVREAIAVASAVVELAKQQGKAAKVDL